MKDSLSFDIAKKEVQKVIVNEICNKGLIDFCQCNSIVKKLDEEIIKLDSKLGHGSMSNMIVKVLI